MQLYNVTMFEKLASVEARYQELMASLGTSTVQNDPAEYRKQAKALSEIEPLVEKFREYQGVADEIAQAEELAKGADAEMRALAEEELGGLDARRRDRLDAELKVLLLPKDPERREERHRRNPRRHRRRGSGAVCRRPLPHVFALCRAPGLEARDHVAQRGRRRAASRKSSSTSRARASTAS